MYRKSRRAVWAIVLLMGMLLSGCQSQTAAESHPTTQSALQTEPSAETEPSVTTEPTEMEPELLTGWQERDGDRYYYDAGGVPVTGWLELEQKRYYLDEAGVMQTGWLTLEGDTYYLHSDGVMAVGQVEIDGRNHFFTSAGVEALVINPWNLIPEDLELELVTLETDYALEGMRVQVSCYEALRAMILDCNRYMAETYGGTDLYATAHVISAYRTHAHQTQLYENRVQQFINEGYSEAEARVAAATINAYPGTSEHESGFAVDIIDTHLWKLVSTQDELPAQQWLMANSWRYGFILRYPKDKTEITGVIYEPWHYRYVGEELAKELYESGLTMEEYFDTLSENDPTR